MKKIIIFILFLFLINIVNATTIDKSAWKYIYSGDKENKNGFGVPYPQAGHYNNQESIAILKFEIPTGSNNLILKINSRDHNTLQITTPMNAKICSITSQLDNDWSWNNVYPKISSNCVDITLSTEQEKDVISLGTNVYGYAIIDKGSIDNIKVITQAQLQTTTTQQTQAKCWGKNAAPLPEGTVNHNYGKNPCVIDMPRGLGYFYFADCKDKCREKIIDDIYPYGFNYDMGDGLRTHCWKVKKNMIGEECYKDTHVCNIDGLCVPKQAKTCSDPDDGLDYYNKNTVKIKENQAVIETKTDSCSGNVLTEYTCDGVNIKSNTYNCLDEGKTCYNGACREPDSDQNYCTGDGWSWIDCDPLTKCEEVNGQNSICCGDDNNEYYITAKWDNSETTDPVCCNNPNDKIHNNKCASKEPIANIYTQSYSNPSITFYDASIGNTVHHLWHYTAGYAQHHKWCQQPHLHDPPFTRADSISTQTSNKLQTGGAPIRLASNKNGRWQCRDEGGSPPCSIQYSPDHYISSITCQGTEWIYEETTSYFRDGLDGIDKACRAPDNICSGTTSDNPSDAASCNEGQCVFNKNCYDVTSLVDISSINYDESSDKEMCVSYWTDETHTETVGAWVDADIGDSNAGYIGQYCEQKYENNQWIDSGYKWVSSGVNCEQAQRWGDSNLDYCDDTKASLTNTGEGITKNYCCGDDPNEYYREPSNELGQGWPNACCDKSTDCVWTDGICYDLAHHSSLDPATTDEYLCRDADDKDSPSLTGPGYFWDRCFSGDIDKKRIVDNVEYICNNGIWTKKTTSLPIEKLEKHNTNFLIFNGDSPVAEIEIVYNSATLKVKSAGFDSPKKKSGGFADFQITDDTTISETTHRGGWIGRGFNFIVLDKNTLTIKAKQRFDTHDASHGTAWDSGSRPCYGESNYGNDKSCDVKEMINFIDNINEGDIVLVGVADEGSRRLNEDAYNALKKIRSSLDFDTNKLGYRDSYALIGIKKY